MKIIIALIGKSGAGKDTILKELCLRNPFYNNIVSCTTRPPRENEMNGIDYYFISDQLFAEKILNGDMLEATMFNNWGYGTMLSSLKDGINIGVFNPDGFRYLTELHNDNIKVIGFYVHCNDKIRLLRQLNRESDPDVKEIVRRYTTDEFDFSELEYDVDYNIRNETEEQLYECATIIQDIADRTLITTKSGQN
jgi:guanylate kinase